MAITCFVSSFSLNVHQYYFNKLVECTILC